MQHCWAKDLGPLIPLLHHEKQTSISHMQTWTRCSEAPSAIGCWSSPHNTHKNASSKLSSKYYDFDLITVQLFSYTRFYSFESHLNCLQDNSSEFFLCLSFLDMLCSRCPQERCCHTLSLWTLFCCLRIQGNFGRRGISTLVLDIFCYRPTLDAFHLCWLISKNFMHRKSRHRCWSLEEKHWQRCMSQQRCIDSWDCPSTFSHSCSRCTPHCLQPKPPWKGLSQLDLFCICRTSTWCVSGYCQLLWNRGEYLCIRLGRLSGPGGEIRRSTLWLFWSNLRRDWFRGPLKDILLWMAFQVGKICYFRGRFSIFGSKPTKFTRYWSLSSTHLLRKRWGNVVNLPLSVETGLEKYRRGTSHSDRCCGWQVCRAAPHRGKIPEGVQGLSIS